MGYDHRYSRVPQFEGELFEGNGFNRRSGLLEVYFQDEDEEDWTEEETRLREKIYGNREELLASENELEDAKKLAEESRKYWRTKVELVEQERNALIKSIEMKQEALNGLYFSEEDDLEITEPPSGPGCFAVVEATWFVVLSSVILVANMVTIALEMLHPRYKVEFFWLDQAFMVFYVVELILKACYHRGRLLCGPISLVWWNYLDLIVVSVGAIDQWFRPAFEHFITGASSSNSSSVLQLVRMLRLARLARVLKIIRIFFHSDLSWAEGASFQLFIMGVIGFNSLLMAFESDHPRFFLWYYVEQVLLVIFSFELAVRLRYWGCLFFARDVVWNILDFIIVVGGIVDQWLMPTIAFMQALLGQDTTRRGDVGQIMVLLRMARLLRILRLVRLVRSVPPLFTLIVGIIQAMQGMMWVLALTAVLLYVFALLSVKLIGHGLLFGGEDGVPEDVAQTFPNTIQSMFVLFMAMNGDPSHLEPMFHFVPISRVLYVAYMVLSSWAILSILTAVISENMISVTEVTKQEIAREEHIRRTQENVVRLTGLVEACDIDNSGTIDRCEFYKLLSNTSKAEELCDAVGSMTTHELKDLYENLSALQDGKSISTKAFIKGLQDDAQPVRWCESMRLEKRIARMERILSKVEVGIRQSSCALCRLAAVGASAEPSPKHATRDLDGQTSSL